MRIIDRSRAFGRRLNRTLTRSFFRSTKRIESLEDAAHSPDFLDLRNLVRASGTDSLSHFGNGYEVEGGLCLQQNPDEFAGLCLFLRKQRPITNYLEIGCASGGACRFLFEHVGMERIYILDDGGHPRFSEQESNLSFVKGVIRHIGDSHSDEARRFLANRISGTLDVAFIDGDHSYEGVWADLRLTMAFSRPGTVVVFHDTVACDGVERGWLESVSRGLLEPLAEFVGKERPLGIAVGAVK
jgi:hypothetical protein